MENLKSITIDDLLDKLTKKASYDLIYVSYLRDIVHTLLDQKQLVGEMSLGGESEKAYKQAYDDILRLVYILIMNKLYGTNQSNMHNVLYTDTDSVSKGEN